MRRVAIVGGAGRMGQAIAQGLNDDGDVKVTALIDVHEPHELFAATYFAQLDELDASLVDVVVDFSAPDVVVTTAHWCALHRVPLIIGTTGLSVDQRAAVYEASQTTGIIMASNFSLGAVLADRFARMAAPYFTRVEIVELHHDRKADAPSGTSLTTARAISEARAAAGRAAMVDSTTHHTVAGARGAEGDGGVRIHSVRLPGLVAHQEILFGGPGEGLTIRHDSFDRQSFVQGVALAVRSVQPGPGLTLGIDSFVH